MQIRSTALSGVLTLHPEPHRDDRGLFTRTFDAAQAATHGIDLGPACQDSQSRSVPGVIRGMHTRSPGSGEAKLVRCARGRVLDMIVDARPGSPTLGEHLALELDDTGFVAVWIPAGFLHGFQVLSDTPADVCYRIDTPHDPTADLAVHVDDPALRLPWRDTGGRIISDRDAAAGDWAELLGALRHDQPTNRSSPSS